MGKGTHIWCLESEFESQECVKFSRQVHDAALRLSTEFVIHARDAATISAVFSKSLPLPLIDYPCYQVRRCSEGALRT